MTQTELDKCVDWDFVKDKIFPRLVKRVGNEDKLKSTLRKDIFDMSIIFYVHIDSSWCNNLNSYKICMMTDYYTDQWGKSFDEVYSVALKNLEGRKKDIIVNRCEELVEAIDERGKDLTDKLKKKISEEGIFKDVNNEVIENFVQATINEVNEFASNLFFLVGIRDVCCGSSIILSKAMLDEIAKNIGESFYCIPVYLGTLMVIKKSFDEKSKNSLNVSTKDFIKEFINITLRANNNRKQGDGKQEEVSKTAFLYNTDTRKLELVG